MKKAKQNWLIEITDYTTRRRSCEEFKQQNGQLDLPMKQQSPLLMMKIQENYINHETG